MCVGALEHGHMYRKQGFCEAYFCIICAKLRVCAVMCKWWDRGVGGVNDVLGRGVMLGFCGEFKLESVGRASQLAQRGRLVPPKAERYTQPGRLLSGWGRDLFTAGYHSQCWRATSRNRESRCKECNDSTKRRVSALARK